MELRNLKTFRAVATLLSFHRAARTLHYAQSTVSAQVQALEEELGVRLFDRLGRAVLLTEAGRKLLQYTERLLNLEEETRLEVGRGQASQGGLTIRVPETLCATSLAPAIQRFHRQHPGVALHLTTCAHDSLGDDLRKGLIDLAFLYTDTISAGDMLVEALATEEVVLVAAPGHPLARGGAFPTAALAGHTLLLSRSDCSYRKLFERLLAQQGVKPAGRLEFNSGAGLMACLRSGLGLGILPRTAIAAAVGRGELAVLPWEEGALEVAVLMLWLRQKWLSPTLRAFMDQARRELGRADQAQGSGPSDT